MKKAYRKKIHLITIEYPFMSILIMIIMCIMIISICTFIKIDKYYQIQSKVYYDETYKSYVSKVDLPYKYFEKVKRQNNMVCYADLESEVYEVKLVKSYMTNNQCKMILKVNSNNLSKNENLILNFKLSYGTESVLQKIAKEIKLNFL